MQQGRRTGPPKRLNSFACSQSNEQERAGLKPYTPNLWVSTDMLVTPGTEKSKSGTRYPSLRAKGSTKPPRHASEWHSTPRAWAACSRHGTHSNL